MSLVKEFEVNEMSVTTKALVIVFVRLLILCSCSNNNTVNVDLDPESLWDLMTYYEEPVYPIEMVLSRIDGIAVVWVVLGAQGKVIDVEVLEASNQYFATSAERSARLSKYIGVKLSDSESVASQGKLIYYFTSTIDPPRVTLVNDKHSRKILVDALNANRGE